MFPNSRAAHEPTNLVSGVFPCFKKKNLICAIFKSQKNSHTCPLFPNPTICTTHTHTYVIPMSLMSSMTPLHTSRLYTHICHPNVIHVLHPTIRTTLTYISSQSLPCPPPAHLNHTDIYIYIYTLSSINGNKFKLRLKILFFLRNILVFQEIIEYFCHKNMFSAYLFLMLLCLFDFKWFFE